MRKKTTTIVAAAALMLGIGTPSWAVDHSVTVYPGDYFSKKYEVFFSVDGGVRDSTEEWDQVSWRIKGRKGTWYSARDGDTDTILLPPGRYTAVATHRYTSPGRLGYWDNKLSQCDTPVLTSDPVVLDEPYRFKGRDIRYRADADVVCQTKHGDVYKGNVSLAMDDPDRPDQNLVMLGWVYRKNSPSTTTKHVRFTVRAKNEYCGTRREFRIVRVGMPRSEVKRIVGDSGFERVTAQSSALVEYEGCDDGGLSIWYANGRVSSITRS
jgi:hypothetical protein